MLQKVVSGLDSWNIIFSLRLCVVRVLQVRICSIRPKTILEFGRRNPPCNAEDNLRAGLIVIEARFRGLLRESWTKGSSSVRPVSHGPD